VNKLSPGVVDRRGLLFRVTAFTARRPVVKPTSADELGMEAGFVAILLAGSMALCFGLAFGVLRVTLRAMAAAGVTATTRAELTGTGLPPLR
jgi:hypothetical protein